MSHPIELWGGAECTIVRLGDAWRDQSVETGHATREGDIVRIAGLGVKRLRFPILWEAVAPEQPDLLDFSRTDRLLDEAREHGLAVVGGLLHHGSGPHYTDLLDPDFPAKLGDYAARVAEHYPWIEMWTPVNEPLTTARFSALYGHWYPHARDTRLFLRALVNQCLGTLTAMRAIRAVNPRAQLVQTEDLGKTFSTPLLAYQAALENERRWLSLDLLCGRVGADHPWRSKLLAADVPESQLDDLASGEAAPDLIGINHYLTSERFLDHRPHLYPGHEAGGNGQDHYVDVEAVRVRSLEGEVGLAPRLREAWARYRLPMAVTEVHHGCSRDEQLRWFAEIWRTASTLRDQGMDLRAVTLWSLFGNVDWRSLLTRRDGVYDTGAFDVAAPAPRPTVVAAAAKAFAAGRSFDHPVLDAPGWWRRPQRFYDETREARPPETGRKLLITGATGTLGRAFARVCAHRGLPFHLSAREELDICDPASVREAVDRHRPWALINTAGFVRVADAEREREACFRWNAEGPAVLADQCGEAGIPLATFSSDLVFDGRLGRAYLEDDPVSPTCAYGESKAEVERRLLESGASALIVRAAAFFGPWDEHNFAHHVLETMRRGDRAEACPSSIVSPTYVPDLCHATLDLLIDGEQGIWHLANEGALSWRDFARQVAAGVGYSEERVRAAKAGPTRNNALASKRGGPLRPLPQALDAWLEEARAADPLAVAAE